MNKKMRELVAKIKAKTAEARVAQKAGDKETCKTLLTEIEGLQEELSTEKALFEAEKAEMDGGEADGIPTPKAAAPDGFAIIGKIFRRAILTDVEKALVTGGTDGEDYLVPEDVSLAIRELRKEFKEAKALVNVIPTASMAGGFNFETGETGELDTFEDGANISMGQPSFAHKSFAIKLCGKLIPISNILRGAEKAGLMAYIRNWFVRLAIRTENKKIFAQLRGGKTAIEVTDWAKLKAAVRLLNSAAKAGAVIVTNQSGFGALDDAVDGLGRPVLQTNPQNATEQLFQGLVVHVFDDAELPNVDGKAPFFFGNLKAACYFIELNQLKMAASEHALFGKNQTALRMIEGFDVIGADTGAYEYALLDVAEYTVTFTVKQGSTDVKDAVVTVNGTATATTNASGVATLTLPNGNYNYTVTKEGLATASGNFGVYGAAKAVAVAVAE